MHLEEKLHSSIPKDQDDFVSTILDKIEFKFLIVTKFCLIDGRTSCWVNFQLTILQPIAWTMTTILAYPQMVLGGQLLSHVWSLLMSEASKVVEGLTSTLTSTHDFFHKKVGVAQRSQLPPAKHKSRRKQVQFYNSVVIYSLFKQHFLVMRFSIREDFFLFMLVCFCNFTHYILKSSHANMFFITKREIYKYFYIIMVCET